MRDAGLRNQAFYVADGPLYSLEDKKKTPTLWLTRGSDNLVLHHLNDEVNSSYEQLIKNGNYRPAVEEARQAMEAKGTLRIDLTKLRLHGNDAQWCYMEISTTKYRKLKAEERKLAERFYGQGEKFSTAMATLKEAGINATNVYVLNPEYVRQEANEGTIGRAAWRINFDLDADSDAFGHNVDYRNGLRGVRLGEAPAAKNGRSSSSPEMNSISCYEILLANPTDAVRGLNDKTAAGLSRILADYLTSRTQ